MNWKMTSQQPIPPNILIEWRGSTISSRTSTSLLSDIVGPSSDGASRWRAPAELPPGTGRLSHAAPSGPTRLACGDQPPPAFPFSTCAKIETSRRLVLQYESSSPTSSHSLSKSPHLLRPRSIKNNLEFHCARHPLIILLILKTNRADTDSIPSVHLSALQALLHARSSPYLT
jgi:hypothetical protein